MRLSYSDSVTDPGLRATREADDGGVGVEVVTGIVDIVVVVVSPVPGIVIVVSGIVEVIAGVVIVTEQ